jgi:hypothetical protein
MSNNNRVQEILNNNAFLGLLAQLDGGRVVSAAADKYPLLIEAVHGTGKKGRLCVELTVVPAESGEVRTVGVQCKITTRLPEKDVRETLFFVTEDMRLQRDDPAQLELPGTEAAPPSEKSSASWKAA